MREQYVDLGNPQFWRTLRAVLRGLAAVRRLQHKKYPNEFPKELRIVVTRKREEEKY
ncbi:MAG: hypothetical protein H5U02_01495 [Clostridia bacterium]|nr:hypothetical protein [Clostridia bacterium]